jgi:hypothetical protein
MKITRPGRLLLSLTIVILTVGVFHAGASAQALCNALFCQDITCFENIAAGSCWFTNGAKNCGWCPPFGICDVGINDKTCQQCPGNDVWLPCPVATCTTICPGPNNASLQAAPGIQAGVGISQKRWKCFAPPVIS